MKDKILEQLEDRVNQLTRNLKESQKGQVEAFYRGRRAERELQGPKERALKINFFCWGVIFGMVMIFIILEQPFFDIFG